MNRFCRDCRNIIVPGHPGGNLTWARCAVAPERDPVSGEMRNAFAAETRGPGGKCGPDGALFEPKAKAV